MHHDPDVTVLVGHVLQFQLVERERKNEKSSCRRTFISPLFLCCRLDEHDLKKLRRGAEPFLEVSKNLLFEVLRQDCLESSSCFGAFH